VSAEARVPRLPDDPAPDDPAPDDPTPDIAIIGMACRFPGAASPEQFWGNLRAGVESITRLTLTDMLAAGVDADAARDPARVAATAEPDGVTQFDAGFFGFSSRQAEVTDPQQRLFLECAWEALEDAGCDPARRPAAGVFAGSSMSTYLLFNLHPANPSANPSSDLQLLIGNDKDYLATQAAYQLGTTGPALNVQTACSTSLVAVHLACQSLLDHECDLALAGGVTVRVPIRAGYRYEAGNIQSPDGHCRPFDAAAQGTVFASGAGVVVLKRLADALADGDVIDAVIKGSAVNNDGSLKAGFTAPSEDGQAQVVAEALAVAGVEPATIGYVEAHGTATSIGDPIEVAALARAFKSRAGRASLAPATCALGSVKSNLGHLESAAGIAGLIKTVLALKHDQIPATLHFTKLNPAIDLAGTPFYVNSRLAPWPPGQTPRRAGVSSFGIGGTNAHVVVEEAPARRAPDRSPEEPGHPAPGQVPARPYVLAVSARGPGAAAATARRYRDFLADGGPGAGLDLADVCWSAGTRRPQHSHRIAVAGRDRSELTAALATAAGDEAGPAAVQSGSAGKIVFVFPGYGSQQAGMGRQLLAREPVFRAAVERCDEAVRRQAGWSPLAALAGPDDAGDLLGRPDVLQLTLFCVQAGLTAWWRWAGIEPAAVVGHSMGEVAAAHAAGSLSLDDAVRVLHQRSQLIREVTGQGTMLATGLTLDQAEELLGGHGEQVCAAIINSPRSTVLSGDPAALETIAAALAARGVFHRWVSIDFASHSPQMDQLTTRLAQSLAEIHPSAAAVPVISTVTGAPIDGGRLDGGYWAANLRRPVQFAEASGWLAEHGHDLFVEISPHPVLLPAIEDSMFHLRRPGTVVPSLRRGRDEQRSLADGLAALCRAGHPIGWDQLYPAGGFVRLPSYPWQRSRHWIDPPTVPGAAQHGIADWFYQLGWQPKPWPRTPDAQPAARRPAGPERWLVFADSGGTGQALVRRLRQRGHVASVAVPADGYRHDARQSEFGLNPSCAADFTRMLADSPDGYDEVAYLWALDATPAEPAGPGDLFGATSLTCGGALHLAQAMLAQPWAAASRLWLVTRGAQALPTANPRPAPAQASLWGLGRTLRTEHPELACMLVDLDASRPDQDAQTLLTEAAAGPGRPSDQVGFRDGDRFAARLARAAATQPSPGAESPDRFRADACYLITGGLGALGLRVARWMTGHGARYLALVSRHEPAGPARAVIAELAEAGAVIRVLHADVADAGQLAAALREISDSMPPLRGVVHAAGVLDDGILLRQDRARFDRVLAPKVAGAWNLHQQTRRLPLDFFVLFSSVAALWGTAGQGSYAAASAFLDALAHARQAEGLPALSINWGGWSQAGLAASDQAASQMSALGMRPISLQTGVLALGTAMSRQEAQLVIAPVDWTTLRAELTGRIPPLLADLCGPADADSVGEDGSGQADPGELLRRLDAAAPGTRRRVLAIYLAEQARLALGLPPQAELDPGRPLNDFGLNSLGAIEVRNTLGNAVGQTLPATVLFDYPAIADLADYLADQVLKLPPAATTGGPPAPGPLPPTIAGGDAPGADIAKMSADEAEAALAGEITAMRALLGEERP